MTSKHHSFCEMSKRNVILQFISSVRTPLKYETFIHDKAMPKLYKKSVKFDRLRWSMNCHVFCRVQRCWNVSWNDGLARL